jgi:hypothetical protein
MKYCHYILSGGGGQDVASVNRIRRRMRCLRPMSKNITSCPKLREVFQVPPSEYSIHFFIVNHNFMKVVRTAEGKANLSRAYNYTYIK